MPMPLDTSEWYAWVDLRPPGPRSLNVQGIVTLPTPGYQIRLAPSAVQGANPKELLLDLSIVVLPGSWIQVVTRKSVSYRVAGYRGGHDAVVVRLPDAAKILLRIAEVR